MSKRLQVRPFALLVLALVLAGLSLEHAHAAATDIVLYASDAKNLNGNWSRASDSSAAGGQLLASIDYGWATTNAPLASPGDYFEFTFTAPANMPYHVWLRLRAGANSKYNDSIWAQFSDSVDANGSALYRVGTTSGLAVNLQSCNGCALSGWGWMDGAYWLSQATTLKFSTSGTHTLRIQTREDGVSLDQVVLSPSNYLTSAPGQLMNDMTIVPQSSSAPSTATSAYSGSPAAIPGTIGAENFDNGGEGVAYHDTTAGNAGGAYRQTDVDIETSSEGGYDVGWIAAGEWLNYTVNVSGAGDYALQLRVASPNGASCRVGFNGSSSGWTTVAVPATGGWQNWTTVTVPVTLVGGTQVMTIAFDTPGLNLRYVKASVSGSVTPSTAPYSGTPASVPGRIEAENFDNGGEGVAYHDTTPGNAGGQYRSTDVDIEASSDGGYDVGWTAPGEWLNYTVNVASAGTYTAQLRVASPNGGSMHVAFNSASNIWASVAVPATGGWQSWTTISVPVTLGAGVQQMTLMFDTGGINITYVNVARGSTGPPPSGGTEVIVAEWNIEVDDASSAHARTVIDYLAALSPQPQILVLTEARGSQYNTYLNELQNRTPYTWQGAFQSQCPLGAWNGSSCTTSEDEGVAIFTSLPVVGSSATYLPYADAWHSARALVRLAVSVNGTTVQVMGTHLQVGDATARNNSMSYLKNWASNFPAPQLVGGDFNADPDQIDVAMLPNFIDSWFLVNSTRGLTCPTPSPTMKLDYWFADASGRATPNWSAVPTGTGTVSDHFPIHTSFAVRP